MNLQDGLKKTLIISGTIIKYLIDRNAMEKYIARIELQLLNRVINTLNK